MKNFIKSTKLQALTKGVLGLSAIGMFIGSWTQMGGNFW